ncbi:Rha family transcriptional regulator [Bilophila wadsworthia]|uniref:Rha family transcriptional regulator n=1 Tax=Bilophila wadsworthia TaxID=35833 RepID=UPI002675F82B|nr:Rha family transcriptional regulator [Bilophila wadsworthia]
MIQTESGIPTTTSLVIAQAFEKEHKDVLRAIYNMECSPEFNERNFAPVGYKDAKGEIRPAYRLTRDGFAFLAMGFTGKKAAAWKERFLEAFNAMEAALLRQRQRQETPPKEPEQPAPRTWEKPEFFRSARKLTKAQAESLLGVLNMECLLQNRQPEDALKELLTFFHLSSLEDHAPVRLPPCRLFRDEKNASDLRQNLGRSAGIPPICRRHRRAHQFMEPLFRLHQKRYPKLRSEQMWSFNASVFALVRVAEVLKVSPAELMARVEQEIKKEPAKPQKETGRPKG